MNIRAALATVITVAAIGIICYFQVLFMVVLGVMLCLVVLFLLWVFLTIIYELFIEWFEDRDNRTKDNKCAEETQ